MAIVTALFWLINLQSAAPDQDLIPITGAKIIFDENERLTLQDVLASDLDTLTAGKSSLFYKKKSWMIIPTETWDSYQNGFDLAIIGMTDQVIFHYYERDLGWSKITSNRRSNIQSEDHFFHPSMKLERVSFDHPIVLEINEAVISLIAIEKRATKFARHELRNIIASSIISILLFIVGINLVRGIQFKEFVYIIYAIYVIFNIADLSAFEGNAILQFFGIHSPTARYNVVVSSIYLFNVMGAWYGIVFLRLRTTNRKFYRAIQLYLVLVFVAVVILFFDTTYIFYITNICIATLATILFLAGISQWRKGLNYVGYYVLAYFLFATITAYYTYARVVDVTFPYTTVVPLYFLGFLAEAILLNISLNQRIYFEKQLAEEEKERSQKEFIEYQLQQNLVLEEKVVERTRELQDALDSLKQTQSQLIKSEKMASLGILSAGVSHEINNPLNFIKGGVDGLDLHLTQDERAKDEDANKYINIIKEGVKRATSIVKSLSHFSRSAENLKETCHIHDILDNCLVILSNRLKHRINVEKEYYAEDLEVTGNEGRLHQAFLNILSNAEQAIAQEGKIRIETYPSKKEVTVKVSDTGAGIPDKQLSKIMDPFYTTKAPGEGTGLGLSITYHIIEEHNGTIEVDSKVGKGTVFTVKLPISN